MVHEGMGTLGKVGETGYTVTDGTAFYYASSLRLRRLLRGIRRDRTVTGKWLVIGDVIVYFEKIKCGSIERGAE